MSRLGDLDRIANRARNDDRHWQKHYRNVRRMMRKGSISAGKEMLALQDAAAERGIQLGGIRSTETSRGQASDRILTEAAQNRVLDRNLQDIARQDRDSQQDDVVDAPGTSPDVAANPVSPAPVSDAAAAVGTGAAGSAAPRQSAVTPGRDEIVSRIEQQANTPRHPLPTSEDVGQAVRQVQSGADPQEAPPNARDVGISYGGQTQYKTAGGDFVTKEEMEGGLSPEDYSLGQTKDLYPHSRIVRDETGNRILSVDGNQAYPINSPMGQSQANFDRGIAAYNVAKEIDTDVLDRAVTAEEAVKEKVAPRVEAMLKLGFRGSAELGISSTSNSVEDVRRLLLSDGQQSAEATTELIDMTHDLSPDEIRTFLTQLNIRANKAYLDGRREVVPTPSSQSQSTGVVGVTADGRQIDIPTFGRVIPTPATDIPEGTVARKVRGAVSDAVRGAVTGGVGKYKGRLESFAQEKDFDSVDAVVQNSLFPIGKNFRSRPAENQIEVLEGLLDRYDNEHNKKLIEERLAELRK